MLKVLHTGDLHLDTAFAALDERQAQIRKNEMRAAFTSMMTYARMNGIDVVLMAGDIFDNASVTRETVQMMIRELEKFEGPVCIAPGNHDYADTGSVWRRTEFPENVYIFTEPELQRFDFDEKGFTVWGYGFTGKDLYDNPIKGRQAEDPERINLLVCHCDTMTDSSNAPVKEADIRRFGADYAALGHWHNPPQAGEKWAYSGCLEPRNFTETGPKGACVVEIDKQGTESTVRMKRVRFSKRRYETGTLDLSGCETMDDVRVRTEAYITGKKYGEDVLLQLRFTGTTAEGLVINPDLLGNMGLFCLKTEDHTMPTPDPEALAKDTGIRGAFYRTLAPALSSSDPAEKETALRALRYGLAAIAGESITG
ncbi:MAG: DNA repair exonuclease [Clostridia bacterium]|nr:DNA repair exonuclease [Clostridia bacterium]